MGFVIGGLVAVWLLAALFLIASAHVDRNTPPGSGE